MPLQSVERSLLLRDEIVTKEVQHDLDRLGIAKTAREEKKRARDAKLVTAEDQRMAKLYRQHVLKEEPGPDLVQIAPPTTPPKTDEEREEVGSFGY